MSLALGGGAQLSGNRNFLTVKSAGVLCRCNLVACSGSTRVEYQQLSDIAFILFVSQARGFIIGFSVVTALSRVAGVLASNLLSPFVRRAQREYSVRNYCDCKLAAFIIAIETNQPLPNKALHPTAYSPTLVPRFGLPAAGELVVSPSRAADLKSHIAAHKLLEYANPSL